MREIFGVDDASDDEIELLRALVPLHRYRLTH
jgi:hypothetical protein